MADDSSVEIPADLVQITEFGGPVEDFRCGSDPLDEFIRTEALEFSQRRLGETWLLCNEDDVVAFYTLTPASVPDNEYSGDETSEFEKLDDIRYPIPALLLARFGVAESYQNNEIGSKLVDYIIVWAEAQALPFWFIQVDSKEESIGFYKRLNFVTSGKEDDETGITSMYYPLAPRVDQGMADR